MLQVCPSGKEELELVQWATAAEGGVDWAGNYCCLVQLRPLLLKNLSWCSVVALGCYGYGGILSENLNSCGGGGGSLQLLSLPGNAAGHVV